MLPPARNDCVLRFVVSSDLQSPQSGSHDGGVGEFRTRLSIIYSSNIIHTPSDEEYAIWRPSQVIYL